MAEMKVVITKIGLVKITEATIEKPLKLTHFAVGDGNGAAIDPNENMTSLVNEKYRDVVNDTYTNENNLTIECVLRANASITTGFKIFELGIFDKEGDMIAITQTPEQYRPAPSEGIATEWIASVVLQLSNTDKITIEIPQTVYATVDALQRLLNRVEILENNKQALIVSSVGVEKLFNTDNADKDKNIITRGVKTYALMDDSNVLRISDYPLLFKNIKAVDRGDGTFAMPKFHDGTTRHLPKGNSRNLGSYEADDFKAHEHRNDHIHPVPHEHKGSIAYVAEIKETNWQDILQKGRNVRDYVLMSKSLSTSGGREVVTQAPSKLKTDSAGGAETRMKNTAGQWYILAKVNI